MIVTLQLAETAKAFFDPLRKQYFPGHINYLEAHLTLFHALSHQEPLILKWLEKFSHRQEMELTVTGLENYGKAVAYKIESTELQTLHMRMQEQFKPFLKGKDLEPLRPHITIQKNVTAYKARLLFEKLTAEFSAFKVTATGFSTFQYENGPWSALKDYPFQPG